MTTKPTKPTPVAQAEKQASIPKPVTQSALAADDRFGNMLIAERDTAVIELQALQSQLAARSGKYERDMERLQAEYQADYKSLTAQIGQYTNISKAADAALESLKSTTVKPDNVVQMKEA